MEARIDVPQGPLPLSRLQLMITTLLSTTPTSLAVRGYTMTAPPTVSQPEPGIVRTTLSLTYDPDARPLLPQLGQVPPVGVLTDLFDLKLALPGGSEQWMT